MSAHRLPRLAIAVFTLALCFVSAAPSVRDEKTTLTEARAALTAKDPAKASELVLEYLSRSIPTAELEDVLGQALLQLGRKDEAASHFRAAIRLTPEGAPAQKLLRANLTKADALANRKAAHMQKVSKDLLDNCQKLYETGHKERALAILGPLEPIATGPEKLAIVALAAKIRAASQEVKLEGDGDGASEGERPLVELEGKHYRLEANLEPAVAQRVADVMDDIFNSYVKIYFDDDASRVVQQKPTIRIHPSRDAMLADWQGESKPEGWWSPGEWKVVCYDTRTNSGKLDNMLMTLYHEASHHFMTMLAKGGGTPAWINEGTASFFEGARAMEDRRVLWPDAAFGRLVALKYQLTGGRGPSVDQVLSYNQPGSYPGEYYSYGWGLVYFLQQYEDPNTLEYVFRPLYSTYRETIAARGGNPMELFKTTFLQPKAPGGFTELEPWVANWRKWILEEVYPLHEGSRIRELRLEKIRAYIAAADRAAGDKAAKVGEVELLSRALGHLEFVIKNLDGTDHVDPELLLTQADVLERMGRPQTTASLIEQVLDLVDAGEHEFEQERYDALEKRLAKLDAKNQALRLAKVRAKNYAKIALKLLDDVAAGETPMTLSSYEFARLMADALESEALAERAAELREKAQEAGLLRGALYAIGGKPSAWVSIFDSGENGFETTDKRVAIEGVRPVGRIFEAIPLTGEYELRCHLGRVGEIARTTYQGVVVAGTPTAQWIVAGIDGKGQLLVRRYVKGGSELSLHVAQLTPPAATDESPQLKVRVAPGGKLSIRVGDRAPVEVQLEEALPAIAHIGVFAKNGRTELTEFVLEVFP